MSIQQRITVSLPVDVVEKVATALEAAGYRPALARYLRERLAAEKGGQR